MKRTKDTKKPPMGGYDIAYSALILFGLKYGARGGT